MSSLVSGNSILHIANRLGDLRKESGMAAEGEMDLPTTPPSSEHANDEAPLKFRLVKDITKNTYSTVPSTSLAETERPQTTPTQATPPPEATPTLDLVAAVSQMQQQMTNSQNIFGTPQEHLQNQQGDNMLTMRDLLPGYSPWLRNAGRKKSHPVWEFFKDLKDTNGVGGVVCLHCNWMGDDRSPNNLRTHLKKFHTNDGVFAKFSQKLAQVRYQAKHYTVQLEAGL